MDYLDELYGPQEEAPQAEPVQKPKESWGETALRGPNAIGLRVHESLFGPDEEPKPAAAPAASGPDFLDELYGGAGLEAKPAEAVPAAEEDGPKGMPLLSIGGKTIIDAPDWLKTFQQLDRHGTGAFIESLANAGDYVQQFFTPEGETMDPNRTTQAVREWAKGFQQDAINNLSKRTSKLLQQDLHDTDWSDMLDALIIKSVDTAPGVVAGMMAGGGAGLGAQALGAGTRAIAGASFAGAVGTGAAQGVGQVYQDIAEGINKASDAELKAASPSYADNRNSGMSEEAAKAQLVKDAGWMQPLLAGAVTGLTSKFGIEGLLAKKMAGELITEGFIKGGLKGFMKGAVGEGSQEFIENASQELLTQSALIKAGTQKQVDWGKVYRQGVEGAAVGGLIGGGTGAAFHGGRRHGGPALKSNEGDKTQSSQEPGEGDAAPVDPIQQPGESTPGGMGGDVSQPATAPQPGGGQQVTTVTTGVDPDVQAATESDEGLEEYDPTEVAEATEEGTVAAPQPQDDDLAALLREQPTVPGVDRDAGAVLGQPAQPAPQAAPRKTRKTKVDQVVDAALEKAAQIQPPAPVPPPAVQPTPQVPSPETPPVAEPLTPVQPQEPPVAPPEPVMQEPAPVETAPLPVQPEEDLLAPEDDESFLDADLMKILGGGEIAPTPVEPEPAPVREETGRTVPPAEKPRLELKGKVTVGEKLKERRRVATPKAEKGVAFEEAGTVEHAAKPNLEGRRRSTGVAAVIGDAVRGRLEKAGWSEGVSKRAFERAMTEFADEADSSQHGNVAEAAKALRDSVAKRAEEIAPTIEQEDAEADVSRRAEDIVEGVKRAQETERQKRTAGSGQERARSGKVSGKETEALEKEDFETWLRRNVRRSQRPDATEREKQVAELATRRRKLWGGNAKERAPAREAIAKELEGLRQQDVEEARAKRGYVKPNVPDVEQVKTVLRMTPEERAERAEKVRLQREHKEHDTALQEVTAAHPEPDLKRVPSGRATQMMHEYVSNFIKDLKSRVPVPRRISATASKASNFLAQAGYILNSKLPTIDKVHDLIVLKTIMDNSTPDEFFKQLQNGTDLTEYGVSLDNIERNLPREELTDAAFDHLPNELEDFFAQEQQSQIAGISRGSISIDQHALRSSSGGEVGVDKGDVESLSSALKKAGDPLITEGHMRGWNWAGEKAGVLDGSNGQGISRVLFKLMYDRIGKTLGDVPVYWVDRDQMRTLIPSAPTTLTRGYWIEPTVEGRAAGSKGAIVMNKAVLENPGEAAAVLLHEAAHGMTVYSILNNIDGAANIMEEMRRVLRMMLHQDYIFSGTDTFQYGLTNTLEFAAEAFSNPAFQQLLASIQLPPSLQRKLGDHKLVGRKPASFWDLFVAGVARILNLSGFGRNGMTFLEGFLRLQEPNLRGGSFMQMHALDLVTSGKDYRRIPPQTQIRPAGSAFGFTPVGPEHLVEDGALPVMANAVTDAMQTMAGAIESPGLGQRLRLRLKNWMTATQIAEDTVKYFGRDKNPAFQIVDAMRRLGVNAKQMMHDGDEIVSRYMSMSQKLAQEVSDLVFDATTFNLDPTVPLASPQNAHISKKGFLDYQLRVEHARQAARFAKLTPEQQKLVVDTGQFYRKVQNEMTLQTVRTIIAEAKSKSLLPALPPGKTEQDLEDFVLQGGIDRVGTQQETPDDKAMFTALGNLAVVFKQTTTLRMQKGFYSPLMRRGIYVVRAHLKMPTVPGGQITRKGQLIFKDKAAFQAFLGSHPVPLARKPQTYWYDPSTGAQVKSTDPNAKRAYIVTPQLESMEVFEKLTDASARVKELLADPAFGQVKDVELRDELFESAGREILPATSKKLLKTATEHITDQVIKGHVERAMARALLQTTAHTRIQQRRLRRKGTLGFSRDAARAMADYNISASNHIARLQARPQINEGLEAMRKEIAKLGTTTYDGRAMKLQENLIALERQLEANDAFDPSSLGSRLSHGMLALSFLNHLASVSNWVINSMQPGMVTLPRLASAHGEWGAFTQLAQAYRDLGVGDQLSRGIRNMRFSRVKKNPLPTVEPLINRIKDADEKRMLTELQGLGLIGTDAGFELEANDIRKTAVERGLGWASEFASKMPQVIENLNRASSALAAYRLARKEGMTHQQATDYAGDIVNDTQGDYSNVVAPKVFKSNLAKLVLQFKKYPQMMLRTLVRSGYRAFKGSTPKERKQARKELAYLSVTHGLVAGMGGLPFMEVFKILGLLAKGLGLSDDDWEDFEAKIQGFFNRIMGAGLSEALIHGAPRMIGMDLSARMGLDSLIFFGSPKDVNDVSKVKEWLLDSFAGAPVGVVTSLFSAIANFSAGDYAKAWNNAPFPKQVLDVGKALYGASGNRKKPSGVEIPGSQLSAISAFYKALGFQPAQSARAFEYGGTGYNAKEKTKRQGQKTEKIREWVNASPAERPAVWKRIQEWNKGRDVKDRVTMSALQKAKARRVKDQKKADAEYEATQQ